MASMGRRNPGRDAWGKIKPGTIFALDADLDALQTLLAEPVRDARAIDKALLLTGYDDLLSRYPKAAHERLRFLRSAVARWKANGSNLDFQKARNHLVALRRVLRPVAADSPFEINDRVWVKRYEHGYDVGTGTVTWRSPLPNPAYTVLLDKDDGGYEIHVDRTSWLSPSY